MRNLFLILLIVFFIKEAFSQQELRLPLPSRKGEVSLEETISQRSSIRQYKEQPLSLKEVSQLLWACAGGVDGVTQATRVYPSAGALYPENFYIVVNKVSGLDKGIYKYNWQSHSLKPIKKGDFSSSLARACFSQSMPKKASISIIFTAEPEKIFSYYGRRGEALYLPLEIGTSCENLHLQAQALGLGTVMISAFSEEKVKKILGIEERIYCIMPIGRRY